jgi:hypothetical protein
VETLKWGEPAYLPKKARVGTTVRINAVKGSADRYGAYFHCQTTLLESFRHLYPDAFTYEGSRAILFRLGEAYPGRCATPLPDAGADLSSEGPGGA